VKVAWGGAWLWSTLVYVPSLVRCREFARVDRGFTLLAGGFTVLATKAISTLLTKEWVKMVTEWVTYPILAVSPVTLHMDPALIAVCRYFSSQVSFRSDISTER
jgi:hypothetical protein